MTEIEPGWSVTIMDRINVHKPNEHLQYVAIFHRGHCIDLTRSNLYGLLSLEWFDNEGYPKYCRLIGCGDEIPNTVMQVYKGLLELMRVDSSETEFERHLFQRPATKS